MKMADPEKDLFLELLSTFGGVRISQLNAEKQYSFRVQDAVDDSRLNSRLYYDVAGKDDVSNSQKESALEKANEKLQETFSTLYNHRVNLEELGMKSDRAYKMTKMPAEKDIYVGKKNEISMYIGQAFPIIPKHRNSSELELQKVAKNLMIAAQVGIVTNSQIKSIFRKYVTSDVEREAIQQISTGDYIYDYELIKVVKKELK